MVWYDVFLTSQFWMALLAIVVIDIVLAGDNALVIALAARNLPPAVQKKAIVWGTVGAIVMRALMTLAVVWLLKIPGLLLLGGVALVWIAWKLLTEQADHDEHQGSGQTFWGAMKTIVIADAVMGVDNVLAVAGAAHGSFLLVVMGLLISIPLVVWGSGLVLHLLNRYPWLIYVGGGVLVLTAAKMIVAEPFLKPWLVQYAALPWLLSTMLVTAVLALAFLVRRRRARPQAKQASV